MTISTRRATKKRGRKTQAGLKTPRKLRPAAATIYTREDGPIVQLCGDSEVVGKWINGRTVWDRSIRKNWADSKKHAPMVKKEDSQPYLKD